MSKITIYKIRLYHNSSPDGYESVGGVIRVINELLPEAKVTYEPCKSDFGVLTVGLEEEL